MSRDRIIGLLVFLATQGAIAWCTIYLIVQVYKP